MKTERESDTYKVNQLSWKIFGLWPGKTPTIYYKCYSFLFVTIFTMIYNVLLSVNLAYTPRNIEALIQEVIFFFTEVAVAAKVATILLMRNKILKILKSMDCEEFEARETFSKELMTKSNAKYYLFCKVNIIISHFSYCTLIVFPLLFHFFLHKDLDLPIAKYYFLSDQVKEVYFWYCFIYQSIGIYAHMVYNLCIDSFFFGLILKAITQLKILNYKFSQLKVAADEIKDNLTHADVMRTKLNKLLLHYDTIVKFCADIQEIISMTMFIQFCMASAIICVSMCGLLMVSSMHILYGMVSYLCAMTLEIFVPGWLGTQLGYESQELVIAAYNSKWISESESYKRSLRLFIGRANTPIVIKGLKIFPLNLGTFISIMKMAYSFFALLRNLQDRQI